MTKHNKKNSKSTAAEGNAWVLTSKRKGDKIAGWRVEQLYKEDYRFLQSSERCKLTSFCYPAGSKVVRAKLQKVEQSNKQTSESYS